MAFFRATTQHDSARRSEVESFAASGGVNVLFKPDSCLLPKKKKQGCWRCQEQGSSCFLSSSAKERRGEKPSVGNCTKKVSGQNASLKKVLSRRYRIKEAEERRSFASTGHIALHRHPNIARFFIAVLIMGSLPGIDPAELSDTICSYLAYKDECTKLLEEDKKNIGSNITYCPGEFDSYMCWPHGEAGKQVTAPCPNFFHDTNNTNVGYRFCQTNGTWFKAWDADKDEMVVWRYIENCSPFEPDTNVTQPTDQESDSTLLTNFRIMYSIGYGVSLVCLVVALLLLAFFKKLHCTRNYIHMNLMVSFIIRYVVILVKDSVLVAHYELDGITDVANNPNYDQMKQYCDDYGGAGWVLTRCRIVITLMHYAITANYFWLLAEGLYLQMLLVFVMSENKYFAGFMVFGWGAPWVSVLIWVVLRLQYENSGCWDMNDKLHVWWTIRVPIIISIVINFLIFVNIVRLIVSKLQANNMAHTDIKLRLAKSTLALIPLLGIHYIVFLALTEEIAENTTPMHLKLGFDMFLTSIQGTLVSILYCFLNGEVKTEVRKVWRDWRTRKGLPRGGPNARKSSTIHSGNQSTSVTYFSRHSTTGADCILSDTNHQSPNSVRGEMDNRTNFTVRNNSDVKLEQNGVGNTHTALLRKQEINDHGRNGKFDNGKNYATTMFVSSQVNGDEAKGSVDCQDCVPFLREQSV